MIKKRNRLQKRLTLIFSNGKNGKIHLVILLFIVTIGLLLAGGLLSGKRPPSPGASIVTLQYQCCDTGDGADCRAQQGNGQTFTYNGQLYGLVRSRIKFLEGNLHLRDTGQQFQNSPIIENSSDTHRFPPGIGTAECRTEPKDKYLREEPPPPIVVGTPESVAYCTSIPDDQLMFVCRSNCQPSACPIEYQINSPEVTCYGDETSVYDVYFRVADEPNIPDFIRNCKKPGVFPSSAPVITSGGQQIVYPQEPMPSPNPKQNLQLKTFKVIEKVSDAVIPWFSPFCKPAIYLYPETKSNVHVQVAPLGKMSYTDPLYPKDGWKVTAYPNGQIDYQNNSYNYLYYEAEIPDTTYQEPNSGYVVEFGKLEGTLRNLLTKLGLNEHEKKEFLSYWLKVLPKSKYYFVGSIPQDSLDSIAPLTLVPKPDTIIRVALYFKALDEKIQVPSPQIRTRDRSGFTVVEWGGIFKRDAAHPFSCFM